MAVKVWEKNKSLFFICRKVHVDRGSHLSRGLVKVVRLKYWEDRSIVRNKFFFHCTKLLGKSGKCRFQSQTKQSGIVELNSLWDTKVMSQCCFKTGSSKQGPVTKPNQTKPSKKPKVSCFLWKRTSEKENGHRYIGLSVFIKSHWELWIWDGSNPQFGAQSKWMQNLWNWKTNEPYSWNISNLIHQTW